MKDITGGVCAPKGFKAGGIWCGIKANSKKRDLALIYSEKACTAAAMFTTNKVQAACIKVSQEHIAGGKLRAIIANSGNANACTGEAGLQAARRMAELAADEFAISGNEVAVASTGVIGVPLPIAAIESSIEALANSLSGDEAGHSAALDAIMTTDIRKKEISVEVMVGNVPVRIGAMCKGSGMVHPNMATMLCFITCDAHISSDALDKSLRKAVELSFHRMTIDGDTSTNDCVIIMASGNAENKEITSGTMDHDFFTRVLTEICVRLSREIARDGEGATKLITVSVGGAADDNTACVFAKSVASSSLVKAAIFGADANWGRVLCALGYAGPDFNPSTTKVDFRSSAGTINVCSRGGSVPFSEDAAKNILSQNEIEIVIDLGAGSPDYLGGQATVWGCDLSYDYVKINGNYRS